MENSGVPEKRLRDDGRNYTQSFMRVKTALRWLSDVTLAVRGVKGICDKRLL
jgi:hypothetical protein